MRNLLLSAALLTFAAGAAQAQALTDHQEAAARAAIADPAAVAARSGGATLDRPVADPGGLQVTAGTGDGAATLKGSYQLSGPGAEGRGVYTLFSVTGSLALDKASGESTFASLSGLTDTTSVELKLTQYTLSGRKRPTANNPEVKAICEIGFAKAKAKLGKDPDDINCTDEDWYVDVGALAPHLTPDELDRLYAGFFERDAKMLIWGLSGKVGAKEHKFLDPVTVAESEDDKTGYSVGAFLALEPLRQKTLYTFAFNHERSYDDADSQILCPPGAGGPVTCLEGAIGPPTRSTKNIVSVEARRRFGSVAAAATISYDAKAQEFGVEAPIYFITDSKNGFVGGVRLGWTEKEDDFTAKLFVGKAFSFYGGVE